MVCLYVITIKLPYEENTQILISPTIEEAKAQTGSVLLSIYDKYEDETIRKYASLLYKKLLNNEMSCGYGVKNSVAYDIMEQEEYLKQFGENRRKLRRKIETLKKEIELKHKQIDGIRSELGNI